MSDVSTLLPIASIGVFAKKKSLIKSAQSLKGDWRFPRVQVDVTEGDVDTAIATYKSQSTHDLILIETDTIDDSFSDRLEALSEYCTEDTAAIIVGPVNDVNLYRTLMSMGVSDYLVHPIETEALADVVAKALVDRLGTARSKLISVVGAKGGVGTSSIAQALALGCSETLNQKTIVIDGAGGASYLTVSLGVEPTTTLREAGRAALADDDDSMKRMLASINDKLDILASGGEPLLDDPIQPEAFENIVNNLMSTYPVVIFDASCASVSIQKILLARSHKVFVVTTPTLSSLRAARTLVQEIKDLHGGEECDKSLIDLVINKKGQFTGQEISKSEAEKAIEHDVSVVIDFDVKLFPAAEIDGVKITEIKNSEKLVNTLLEKVQSLVGVKRSEEISGKSKGGFLEDILGKMKG